MEPPAPFYRAVAGDERISRGDLAYLYLPQSRILTESDPPLQEPHKRSSSVPAYRGAFTLSDATLMEDNGIRVWPALGVVVMDSCELDRQYSQGRSPEYWDSRVAVAPVVFETHLPKQPWERFEAGVVPLYGYFLPPMSAGIVPGVSWPRALIDLRGTTLVSRRQVALNRKVTLTPTPADALGMRLLEFWYMREVARSSRLDALVGKRLRDAVPLRVASDIAHVRLVFDDADALTVACHIDPEMPSAFAQTADPA